MSVIEEHGSQLSADKKIGVETLDETVKQSTAYRKNTFIQTIFWVIMHPQKAWCAWLDHLGITKPLSYNSYAHGNANINIGQFKIGQVNLLFSLGPTPTSDRLFEAHLQFLKIYGSKHFQHDLEFAGTQGEKQRRIHKKELSDKYEDQLMYMATPLDGVICKGEGFFSDVASTQVFFENLKLYTGSMRDMRDIGRDFFVPEKVLKDDKEHLTLSQVGESAFCAVEDKEGFPIKDRNRLNNAQLLGFETLLSLEAMFKIAERTPPRGECFMGQACKQDVDRGVLLNVATLLFFDALAGKETTQERFHQIVGIVHLRAGMVDDRVILQKRYQVLSDLMHIIEHDREAFFAPIKRYFDEKFSPASLSFAPHY